MNELNRQKKSWFPGKTFLLLILGIQFAATVFGQDERGAGVRPAQNNNRLALVIGNGAYTSAPTLVNPPNDAREMAASLKSLGFEVTSGVNLNQREMKRLIREFGQKLKAGGSGLFYYAGHGVQSKGRNYLIPVDADIQSEAEVEDTSVDVNLVLNFMDEAQNGLNIIILDACRNNPFARSFRSASGGLAQVDAPTGTLIAYATAPGSVASDGSGLNGLYTSELLRQMRVPGQTATDMFMNVRGEVMKKTANKQVPWEASSLTGAFYFSRPQLETGMTAKPGGDPTNKGESSASKAADASNFELSYWETIKSSTDPLDFISYLEKYPNGQFVDLARRRGDAGLSAAADKHNQRGAELFGNNRFAEAEAEYRTALYFDPKRSAFYASLARTLEKLGKVAEAEAVKKDETQAVQEEKKEADRKEESNLREKIRIDPNSTYAHGSLGSFFKYRDRWAEAEEAFRSALRCSDYTDDYPVAQQLVEVLLEQKKVAEAETELRAWLQRRPGDAFAYWFYGTFLKNQNRLPEAEPPMKEAARLDASWTTSYTELLVALNKIKEADAVWQQFLRTEKGKGYYQSFASYLFNQKRWTEAEAAYRELIKQKPDEDDHHKYLAQALEAQKKFTEAEAEFREAVRLDPGYSLYDLIEFLKRQKNFVEVEKQHRERVRLEPKADNHYSLAEFLKDQKRFDEAETEYREALRVEPTANRFLYFGWFFRDQKKWKEAEDAYRECTRIDPNYKYCLDYLAQALSEQKKFVEAEAVLRDWLKRLPSVETYQSLGYFLLNRDRPAEAEAVARQSIKLDPKSEQRYAVGNYILLGRSLAKQKKYSDAEAVLRESIRLEPIVGNYSIAEVYSEQQKWVEAETAFREFFRLSPQSDSSRLAFARLLQKVNKQAEAEAEAKKAEAYFRDSLNTYPEYAASYHYLIGSSLEIQNRRAEAEAQYREALRLTPDNLEYIEGLQRVLKLQGKIQ